MLAASPPDLQRCDQHSAHSGHTYNITNSTTLLPGNAFVHAVLAWIRPGTRLNS